MKLTLNESINMVVIEDTNRLNRLFLVKAEEAWDKGGEGCFKLFIKRHMDCCWCSMLMSN